MGLDATVYCDCFERGRLRTQPRPEWKVYVDRDGTRASAAEPLTLQMAFDSWSMDACEHEDGVLLHHYLGNSAMIGFLGETLDPHAKRLPIVTSKVIYSGSHCGDFLTPAQVEQLALELEPLRRIYAPNPELEPRLRHFEQQLHELVDCALRVRKPIAF
jgi:hypothetical protein